MLNKSNYGRLILLAGGKGSRLRPALKEGTPKALAPISEKYFLFYLLKNYASQGVSDFVLSLHYEADKIIDYIQKEKDLKELKIQYIIEPHYLDTGGAIKFCLNNMKANTDEYVFVANADTFQLNSIQYFLNSPYLGKQSLIGLSKSLEANQTRYGRVLINDSKKVIEFSEKKAELKEESMRYNYAGISLLKTKTILEVEKEIFSLENEYFPLLQKEDHLYSVVIPEKFIDIGIPEAYFKFIQEFTS